MKKQYIKPEIEIKPYARIENVYAAPKRNQPFSIGNGCSATTTS